MDAVPRLSRSTLSRLATELQSCAAQSAEHLDEDVAHYVERLSTVWAPRVRLGGRVGCSPLGSAEMTDPMTC